MIKSFFGILKDLHHAGFLFMGQNDTGMSRLTIALGRGGGSQERTGTKFLLPEEHFSTAEIILHLLVQLRGKEKG